MTSGKAARWVLIFCLLFLDAGLLVIPAGHRYHVDEQYYTDAALQMMAGHDYLTPYTNGSYRLWKPILPYWAVAAGFRLFGPGFFGARILCQADVPPAGGRCRQDCSANVTKVEPRLRVTYYLGVRKTVESPAVLRSERQG